MPSIFYWFILFIVVITLAVMMHCPGVADPKSYILVSQLPPEVYKRYVEDVNTAHLTGFTFVIVSIVHLAGGKIPEGNF